MPSDTALSLRDAAVSYGERTFITDRGQTSLVRRDINPFQAMEKPRSSHGKTTPQPGIKIFKALWTVSITFPTSSMLEIPLIRI